MVNVGIHPGKESKFYLRKGFDVVATEAYPALLKRARSRPRHSLANDRLRIHEVAISEHQGMVYYYVNRRHLDRSTLSKLFASRNERKVTKSQHRSVARSG